jgi:pimeloyl-ACP methyl ester carboxylesterase
LIGFSWGAWLSYIIAAKHPALVKKMILVGSGPYEHQYVQSIQETRLSRLNEDERTEYNAIIALLNDPHAEGKAERFFRLGQLAAKTDRYDPIETVGLEPEIKDATRRGNKFHGVLREAQEMRRDGGLLKLAEKIQSPVVALHGDYDPHPMAGVREPLTAKLKDFRIIEIEYCGHKPWIERQAKDKFFEILKGELLVA